MTSSQLSKLMEAYNRYRTLYQRGRYLEAKPFAKEALRLGTEEFGPNDPSTAALLAHLAILCQAQGNYAEAEPLFELALRSTRRPSVPTTRMSLSASTTLPNSTVPNPSTRRQSRCTNAPWRPGRRPSDPSTRMSLSASTTSPCSTVPRAVTVMLSRFTSAPWRSMRRSAGHATID